MALISCPNCGKDISDKAKVCPACSYELPTKERNEEDRKQSEQLVCEECGECFSKELAACPKCGCPAPQADVVKEQPQKVEVTGVSFGVSKKRKKGLLAALIAVVLLIGCGIAFKQYSDKLSVEEYAANFKDTAEGMISGAALAENAGGTVRNVWYNSIYEKSDAATNKYTQAKYGGYNDFNTSLANLYKDTKFKSFIESLETLQDSMTEVMKTLQNPPAEYEEGYQALKELYNAYMELTDLAIDPSGNLNTYTSNLNEASSKVMSCYNAVKLYID